jgi:hypothetical protein
MLRDRDMAKRILELHLRVGAELDASVLEVQAVCSAEELTAYRRAVAVVMGRQLTDIINPIVRAHPELQPPELR